MVAESFGTNRCAVDIELPSFASPQGLLTPSVLGESPL
jgi:hypothetical protein